MRGNLVYGFFVLFVATVAYLTCAYLSLGPLNRLQAMLLPEFPNQYSLLYLPHGVRVLLAWLYGWRAIPLLLPSAFVTFLISADEIEIDLRVSFGILASVASGYLAFSLLTLAGHPAGRAVEPHLEWKRVVAAAILASLINTVLPGWLWKVAGLGTAVIFLGDILGSIVLMICLMFLFRWLRFMGL